MPKAFLDPEKDAPVTLSRDIIKRFLTEEQYIEFINEYKNNRQKSPNVSRFTTLTKPLTKAEWEIAKWYFNDKGTSIAQKARELGIKETTFYNQVQPILVRIAFQNKEKLGL